MPANPMPEAQAAVSRIEEAIKLVCETNVVLCGTVFVLPNGTIRVCGRASKLQFIAMFAEASALYAAQLANIEAGQFKDSKE